MVVAQVLLYIFFKTRKAIFPMHFMHFIFQVVFSLILQNFFMGNLLFCDKKTDFECRKIQNGLFSLSLFYSLSISLQFLLFTPNPINPLSRQIRKTFQIEKPNGPKNQGVVRTPKNKMKKINQKIKNLWSSVCNV